MATYAWADLHGRFDLLMKGLQYINPEDKVYFLGDAADRGPNGWECIQYILNDERFIYLKGNHEDLLCKAIGTIRPEHFGFDWFFWDSKMDLWFANGGEVTYTAIMEDNILSPEEKVNIIHKLKELPFCTVYYNIKNQLILLSHAGCDSCEAAEMLDEKKFIWDRNHLMFYDTWDGQDEIIVHGHTPIELMIEEQTTNAKWLKDKTSVIMPPSWDGHSAYWYGKNHKCNIDTGAVWSNKSVLLNLDTWEEIKIDNVI